MNSPKFERPHRIRFSDCDPAGIVFYPQYFVLFNDLLEAWIDSLLPMGFAGYIMEQRLGMPTVHLEADFKAISRMGDEVILRQQLVQLGNKSLIIDSSCTGAAGEPRMNMTQTLVTTSLATHLPILIPTMLRQAFT